MGFEKESVWETKRCKRKKEIYLLGFDCALQRKDRALQAADSRRIYVCKSRRELLQLKKYVGG
jgi:hypothetical protein